MPVASKGKVVLLAVNIRGVATLNTVLMAPVRTILLDNHHRTEYYE
jgi:hypothetical protein